MKKWELLILTIFLSLVTIAQRSNIKFDHVNIKDGLSQSDVTSILQDSRGLMWLGTQDGLNKYNGFEFKVFSHDLLNTNSISNSYIHVIYETQDSSLWFGTENGLNLFNRETQNFQNILSEKPFQKFKNNVWTIIEDEVNNALWIGTDRGLIQVDLKTKVPKKINLKLSTIAKQIQIRKLLLVNEEEILIGTEGNGLIIYNYKTGKTKQYYTGNSTLKSNVIWDLHIDKQGLISVATNKGVNIYNKKLRTVSTMRILDDLIDNKIIKNIYEDNSGIIWIGTESSGLYKLKSLTNVDHYVYSANRPESLSSDKVNIIYEDNSGIIWVGTQTGVNKFDKQKQYFRHHQYLPNIPHTINDNMVWSIFKDEDGNLLVGTSKGLNIFDRRTGKVKVIQPQFSGTKTIKNQSVYSIYQDQNNRIYVGTDGGLFELKNNKLVHLNNPNHLNEARTYYVFEDNKNRLWLGTKEGLVLFAENRKDILAFSAIDSVENGLPNDVIRVIKQTTDGTIWVGTDGGGLCKVIEKNGEITFKVYKKNEDEFNSLSNNSILSIYGDDLGNIWLGTFGGGLNKFQPSTEQFEHFTEKDGLANNVIYGILEDKKDNLWMTTNKGVSKFNKIDLTFKNFEESDGLQSNEFNTGAFYKSKNGEMFFGGINGFNAFYPDDIHINETKPKPLITDFYLFNKPVEIAPKSVLKKHISELDEIVLKYRENVISFEFASLHYAYPLKNKHKYMLENFDEDWVNIGNNRRANYTNLDPGEYIFKVKVANSDNIWSDEIAQIRVIVKPPFWLTWWFILVVYILIPLGFVYAYVITRISRVKAQKLLLEVQVQERTYEIIKQKEEIESQKLLVEQEKEKAEELLLNILPAETAEELKAKGRATARKYRMTSIMFTDFKSFTKIAEVIKPEELVAELDNYFKNFDGIIEKYDVEKIKTIGDAYMCAGGIPIRNKSNPIDIVLAGLEIQRFMKEYNKGKAKIGEKGWGLRIGIHTGSVIAGVVGIKRFAYDIWGDSVNIASRIEAASNIGKVNISGITYELVKEFFVCEYRGEIKAKNKGLIDMYFVHSIKPELSVDGNGIVPNELFQKYVDLHIYSSIHYRKAEKYIMDRLAKELPDNLHYHDIRHTKDVCAAVERLALMEGIEGDDIFLLKTAAQYHDAGFVTQYANNEDIGAALAREVLPRFGYTEDQIETICKLIQATKVPQKPSNHLEQIICDADLDYLGGDEFYLIADKLKRELMERDIIQSDKQWDELQISFLEAHTYFTKTAIELRQANKMVRVQEIKERLKTYK
jgi:ligand-binding sensor domain-containing protein/class 3 adenylate cyclase